MRRLGLITTLLAAAQPLMGMTIGAGNAAFNASWMLSYDSNLLRYSDRDEDRFRNRAETYPSPIASLDDVRLDWRFSTEYRIELWKNRTLRLRGIANFANHYKVPLKNLGWVSFGLRQDLSRKWTSALNYFYEPKFYIRNYTDIHTDSRQRCEFALNQGSLQLTYRPRWLWEISGICKIKDYQYNKYFTEYDGRLWELGSEAVVRPKQWRMAVELNYGMFDNSGYSPSSLLYQVVYGEDSEVGQSDYEETSLVWSVQRKIDALGYETTWKLSGEHNYRVYTTGLSLRLDPMHSQRQDKAHLIEISPTLKYNSAVDFSLGYGWSVRRVSAPSPIVSQIKNYDRWTVWLRIGYYYE